MLSEKQMKTRTSLVTTTAITSEQYGPRPSVSFSTAICARAAPPSHAHPQATA